MLRAIQKQAVGLTTTSIRSSVRRSLRRKASGKPKGARHQTTLAIEKLLEGEAKEIGRKAIELATRATP